MAVGLGRGELFTIESELPVSCGPDTANRYQEAIQMEWLESRNESECFAYFHGLQDEKGCAILANWMQNKLNEAIDLEREAA